MPIQIQEDKLASVLIIDDGAVTRQALKIFFQRLYFTVITANDGLEGLRKLSESTPALIILDLLMPNFDGMKTLRAMKQRQPNSSIPVIVVSAHTDRQHVVAAVEAGAHAVLSKPFNEDTLHKKVVELLGEEFVKNVKKQSLLRESNKFSPSRFTAEDQRRLTLRLAKHFISLFDDKRKKISSAIELKHSSQLVKVAHDLKGSGTTVGYEDITFLGAELEDIAKADPVDWPKVEECFGRIKARFTEIADDVQRKIQESNQQQAMSS